MLLIAALIDTPIDVCKRRVLARTVDSHPTLRPAQAVVAAHGTVDVVGGSVQAGGSKGGANASKILEPVQVVESFAASMRPPQRVEGFDAVVRVEGSTAAAAAAAATIAAACCG